MPAARCRRIDVAQFRAAPAAEVATGRLRFAGRIPSGWRRRGSILIRINAKNTENSDSGVRTSGRDNMGHVIFRCPKTDKEFDSGFQASPGDLRLLPRGAKINLRCRICGVKHEFQFAAARIDENDQGRRCPKPQLS